MFTRFKGHNILVNTLSPGFVKTDMSAICCTEDSPARAGTRWRSPEEAAQDALYLATLPDDGPTGLLLHEGQPGSW